MSKTVIIITGPTAAGKTALAIKLAQHFQTAVISADSRQCYKEISIGTAKPSPAELMAVPHYFINSHSIREEVNAATFEQLALQYASNIFKGNDTAIMCGGTGLYVRAFCEGMDVIPAIPPQVRDAVRAGYEQNGLTWLQETLQQRDPAFYAVAETQNPARLMRALEVLEATGQSIMVYRTATPQQRNFRIIKIGVTLPKEELHANINRRVDMMIADGLVEEVKSVMDYRKHNALQTVGYTEVFDYLDGNATLAQTAENIKVHTRQYAKRQLTWFRKDPATTWFDARKGEEVLQWVLKQKAGQ
ncbi:tRNA (adenosine(37)-N6)-dimethylallyltransferase MiaA [Chitinophaga horti]|uniref:tRNA dimethylallyltransferase n=1 Tax=Chitinophaga horti TaxID=2920382 RepID=A0ABY6IXI8_9BACT|nr:tRNA (adenosine(37)-N6)-dimethylallyltransferase MiaA [Chitinophaga horti]UYQ91117.1 tRNA (adenosine(37)-N6)-dimethylallyltransferase MiaA [Chitinophaga horti]